MFTRRVCALLLAWPLASPGAFGQVVDGTEAETVQSSSRFAKGIASDLPRAAQLIVQKTNDFRREQDLPAVEVNPRLAETARYFAAYMARTNQYGHQADGSRPADRAKKHGYEYCLVAENIAYQYSSKGFQTEELAESFFEGWKSSPGHRQNMLDPDVTETGVAVAQSEETGYYYAVQMFGRPKSMALEFRIVNESDAAIQYQMGDRTFPLPPRYVRTHQRCRPADLTFQWPGKEGQEKADTTTVRPENGTRLVVTKDQGRFRVKKE
jgi:uncharacterized protein YkwD